MFFLLFMTVTFPDRICFVVVVRNCWLVTKRDVEFFVPAAMSRSVPLSLKLMLAGHLDANRELLFNLLLDVRFTCIVYQDLH